MSDLIECKSCKKGIAKTAKPCPHCGEKDPSGNMDKVGKGCLFILIAFASIIAFAALFGDPKSKETTHQSQTRQAGELSFTAEQYVIWYNQALEEMGNTATFDLGKSDDNGSFITTQAFSTNKNLGLVISSNNKSENIRSITFIGTGDGTNKSGIDVMMGLVAIVMAIENPYMPAEERGVILNDLGIANSKLFDQPEKNGSQKIEIVRNNVRYSISATKTTGIWLTAQPLVKSKTEQAQEDKLRKEGEAFMSGK